MPILHQNGDLIFISTGNHIIKANITAGTIEKWELPKNMTNQDQNQQNGRIETLTTTLDKEILVVSSSLKQLIVFETANSKVARNISINRSAIKICVDLQRNLIIADKTGDVYLCKSDQPPKLLLGHLSILLDMALTADDAFLITCDRDEKIRVSQYPNCYNIIAYCLGHREFVTNIAVCGNHLISASGDGTLKMWDFRIGKELQSVDTNLLMPDSTTLDTFRKKLSEENIEVSAIPITKMGFYQFANSSIIAINLCDVNTIEIYEIRNNQLMHLQTLNDFQSEIVAFNLEQNLIIITTDEMIIYDYLIDENKFAKSKKSVNVFENDGIFSTKSKCQHQRDVTLLYKRKFDNVQEYLERKKQRMNAK